MGTNRKRTLRTSRRLPANFMPGYIEGLKTRDFLGELTENEIPLAKELKVYVWDGWMKEQRTRRD